MKIVIKPASKEDAVYYSDFSGKLLDSNMIPCEVNISFSYPSKFDGEYISLYLTDEDANKLLPVIKQNLTDEAKKQYPFLFNGFEKTNLVAKFKSYFRKLWHQTTKKGGV